MTDKIQNIILAVVVLVAFLAVMPTIITSTGTAYNAAVAANDSATASIVNLIPLVAAVGGIAIAGFIAFVAAKRLKNGDS
jgi:hypothetical protein